MSESAPIPYYPSPYHNTCDYCHKPTFNRICWKCHGRIEQLKEQRNPWQK